MQWEGTGEVASALMHTLVSDERVIQVKQELKGFYNRCWFRRALERSLESSLV